MRRFQKPNLEEIGNSPTRFISAEEPQGYNYRHGNTQYSVRGFRKQSAGAARLHIHRSISADEPQGYNYRHGNTGRHTAPVRKHAACVHFCFEMSIWGSASAPAHRLISNRQAYCPLLGNTLLACISTFEMSGRAQALLHPEHVTSRHTAPC